ncbi:hypothetical protein ACFE04_030234 [Oxalis oulophora]
MEYKDKVKIAFAVLSLAAISILYTSSRRRRRRRRSQILQKGPQSCCYLQNYHKEKPQFAFKRVFADNSYSQFKHFNINNEKPSNSHPYESEITDLINNPRDEFGIVIDEVGLSMKDSYIWVETEAQLRELADGLSKERVFGVDTEHHSIRSFLGFTALIQVSTETEDYLIDTIALHDVMNVLQPVFCNPNICKVFHGADSDILWLQRDFHIYVVNLFDTAKACEVLSKPQRSLAYLLETYCSVDTNKLLQREDWRKRPLSEEMVQYARTDAHYLMYIANCLISELKEQGNQNSSCPDDKFHFVHEASRRSNMICLQLYMKENEDFPGESAASSLIFRHFNGQGASSSNATDRVRRLCAWRDLMARVHDENLKFVLSDQAIVALADKAPSTSTDIRSTIAQANQSSDLNSNLSFSPSPVVCSHMDDLHRFMNDKSGNLEDTVPEVLQSCLGQNGTCPLSIFNYAMLVKCGMQLKNRPPTSTKNRTRNFKQVARKSSRELFVEKFSCKSPVYHNCRIYANDGRLLCYCDRRKLEWYIRRDLAKLVHEDPPAIMLLFEPKGRPEDEDNDFYIQSKKNICVGCGEGKHYLRYRIIPSCYRVHFPEHLKSHRSHDIVLLCVDCHEIAHAAAEKYKRQIAKEFGIPLFVRRVADKTETQVESKASMMNSEEDAGVSPLQLRTAAMALLCHGERMPANRREELIQTVRKYYGGREISEEDLKKALLVGMSPHERRKFEKKRGVSFTDSVKIFLSNEKQRNANGISETVPAEDKEDTNLSTVDKDKSDTDPSDQVVGEESDGNFVPEDSDTKDVHAENNANDLENGSQTDDGNALPKHNAKLSLLGHGPHGKQVVDFLLSEYGEEGIGQFCQRWRQAFVEAIHPRFLPGGWDVTHSGRRDFGEFSVYNPDKRASTTTDITDL